MSNKLKICIADDHTLFRKAMVNLLQSFDRVTSVRDAENGKELLQLFKTEAPHIAIVDLQMPVMDGVEACEKILANYPDTKVIVLTMHDSEKYILHMIEMGVHAFLLKNTDPEEFEKAIHDVIDKDFYHNEIVIAALRRNLKERVGAERPIFKKHDLTDREQEILKLICRELTIKEIGDRLSISENTARNHKANLMEKIGTKNTVGLVKFAYETGIIQ